LPHLERTEPSFAQLSADGLGLNPGLAPFYDAAVKRATNLILSMVVAACTAQTEQATTTTTPATTAARDQQQLTCDAGSRSAALPES
jgi:hypothetical protein